MFKGFFQQRPTQKRDVVLAAGAAVMAVWKAIDVFNDYKKDQQQKEDEK